MGQPITATREELIARMDDDSETYTPGELAVLFRVDAKTPARWAREGKIAVAATTPGGHRRFAAPVVRRFYHASEPQTAGM